MIISNTADEFEPSKQNERSAPHRLENIGRRAAENGAMSVKNVNNDERIPLNESIQRINDVRNKSVNDQIIGKLPINYMQGNERPNIRYDSNAAKHTKEKMDRIIMLLRKN